MSHFFTVVLVNSGSDIETEVERLLAPYSENLEVEPYKRGCFCQEEWGRKYFAENGRTCEECGGTGVETVTYNPQSKWDWFRIGGRWDGVVCRLEEIDDKMGGFNFGDEFRTVERNAQAVSELAEDFTCRAVVTPDGEWHEQSTMGWFGLSSDDSDENRNRWLGQMRMLLAANRECIAVGCDLHI